jgi:hypothetical protein
MVASFVEYNLHFATLFVSEGGEVIQGVKNIALSY